MQSPGPPVRSLPGGQSFWRSVSSGHLSLGVAAPAPCSSTNTRFIGKGGGGGGWGDADTTHLVPRLLPSGALPVCSSRWAQAPAQGTSLEEGRKPGWPWGRGSATGVFGMGPPGGADARGAAAGERGAAPVPLRVSGRTATRAARLYCICHTLRRSVSWHRRCSEATGSGVTSPGPPHPRSPCGPTPRPPGTEAP